MYHNVNFFEKESLTRDGLAGTWRGYLSKYWGLTVSANCHLQDNNDKGEVWVWKAILSPLGLWT
jgi:hypothetical protein